MMTRDEQIDEACTNWICSQESGTVIMARNVWRAAVEWANKNPDWRSVEDKLPDGEPDENGEYDNVLCITDDDSYRVCCYVRSENTWYDCDQDDDAEDAEPYPVFDIVGWMPMPPLPKKK